MCAERPAILSSLFQASHNPFLHIISDVVDFKGKIVLLGKISVRGFSAIKAHTKIMRMHVEKSQVTSNVTSKIKR